MEVSWIILTFTGTIVLIVMIFVFRQNSRDKKEYEDDLKRPTNLHDDQSEANDVE